MLEELRYRHHWYVGQTGTGKTTLQINQAIQDIHNDCGLLFIDPHGQAIDTILEHFPKRRQSELLIFDPTDVEYPVAWNPLETPDGDMKPYIAASFLETLKAIWDYGDTPTPQLDQVIYNTAYAMLDKEDGSILGMYLMLTSEAYRETVIGHITDPVVKKFWKHFDQLKDKDKEELTRSSLNKLEMLLSDYRMRNILGHARSAFDFEGVILVRLPISKLGVQKTTTVGSLILSQLLLKPQSDTPFHVHLDDAYLFDTPALENLLSFGGKENISISLSSQHLDQFSYNMRQAVVSNTGTKTIFRLGLTDAMRLEELFPWDNTRDALFELKPHTARVINPVGQYEQKFDQVDSLGDSDLSDILTNVSRRSYASQRKFVEKRLNLMIANGG